MVIIPKKDIMHYKLILQGDYRPYEHFYMTRCKSQLTTSTYYLYILLLSMRIMCGPDKRYLQLTINKRHTRNFKICIDVTLQHYNFYKFCNTKNSMYYTYSDASQ